VGQNQQVDNPELPSHAPEQLLLLGVHSLQKNRWFIPWTCMASITTTEMLAGEADLHNLIVFFLLLCIVHRDNVGLLG
jgi:hypothetical protein